MIKKGVVPNNYLQIIKTKYLNFVAKGSLIDKWGIQWNVNLK
jgi:hypothetical protein